MKFPLLLLGGLVTICAARGLGQVAPSQALTESLERAYELLGNGEFQPAKAELEKATVLARGPCGECLLGMSHIYASEKKWDQVVAAAQQALPLLSSADLQARAYNQIAVAHATSPAPGSLARAEHALRRGAELGGSWGAIARYNLAEVYARQQRWAETVEAARQYLNEAGAEGTSLKEARVLLCRARDRLPDGAPLPVEGEAPQPLLPEGAVRLPEILSQVRPAYTIEAREARTMGAVVVEATIDEEGCVRHVRALKEQPNGLTESAMRAMRRWVFLPAKLADKPVKVYYHLTVNFKVERDSPPPPG
jgi:TonB family protein